MICGIALMVLTGAYIAVGSGFPSVRAYFDMNELQFFNALPLKLLMALLVINLITVTWMRIPLTPPRYGVWCIHYGIITLICGTALYYHNKVEGVTLIPVKQTVGWFYDNTERALYLRSDSGAVAMHPMPSLPRFNSYSDDLRNAAKLHHDDLQNISRAFSTDLSSGQPVSRTLSSIAGLPDGTPLTIDVLGYYPYADISTDFVPDPSGGDTAIRLRMSDPHTQAFHDVWLSGAQEATRTIPWGTIEFEHRIASSDASLAAIEAAARDIPARVHHLFVAVGTDHAPLDLYVKPGQSYPLGNTGYTLVIADDGFDPAWEMFGTGEIVRALTVRVENPTAPNPAARVFRRMVLEGKDVQTDFAIDDSVAAGPMGKRQKEAIDKNLTLAYRFEDPEGLLPRQGGEKHTIVTCGPDQMVDIAASLDRPATVHPLIGPGEATITASMDGKPIAIGVERNDHMRPLVIEVPIARRTDDEDRSGLKQVIMLRLTSGAWSREVAVPYSSWPLDPVDQWTGPQVTIPGTTRRLQLQLGNTCQRLPADLKLEHFDLVRYDGGDGPMGTMRDFKSTLTVTDRASGDSNVEVAHMNSPIYFDSGNWLFFQSSWDPEGQRWSIIGVGTRPSVGVMLTGCVMIFCGLLYAFWVKPVIIARMKQRALAEAKSRPGAARAAKPAGQGASEELVSSN